jgi:hypothetical protein
MKEVKVTVYGRWTSNTCMKQQYAIALSGVGMVLRGRNNGR